MVVPQLLEQMVTAHLAVTVGLVSRLRFLVRQFNVLAVAAAVVMVILEESEVLVEAAVLNLLMTHQMPLLLVLQIRAAVAVHLLLALMQIQH